ncbi:Wzt carbohydrate-binding domain-containing protein [Paraburkholderia sediminicola]|uniref:Wzt carbohydrate-binding domain-containing protein n=1 Tax=Paraburkholderia sediminicola TaxID=458836 RepID=UPI0038B95BBB
MSREDGAFPGRVIFDHLPKTAGQAINAWLVDVLGAGCVSTNLIGAHRDLIRRYGGLYSVISAHVFFHNAEGLDPRYQYMTFFREPVDRAISWIFYLANDVGIVKNTVSRKHGAAQFLASEGHETSAEFLLSVENPYTEHFCRVHGSGLESDEEKIANALAAIQQYDVVGLYEDMPTFLEDVAALLDVPAPKQIAPVNVTSRRLAANQISPALRERIIALNRLDMRLYADVVAWKASTAQKRAIKLSSQAASKWKKYEPVVDRVVSTPDITIIATALREGSEIRSGQVMTFDVDFVLKRELSDLEMGIHLFDADRQWAFGTNSTLLGRTRQSLLPGAYRVSHHLVANLPAGKYTAGFAFAERLVEGQRELAWHDVMCEFEVYHQIDRTFAGYSYLPAEISLRPIKLAAEHDILETGVRRLRGSDNRLYTHVGERTGHDIGCTGQAGYLIFGPYIALNPGHYRLAIFGALGEGGIAGAHMDVAIDKGERVIAECPLDNSSDEGSFATLPISLDVPCSDLEIRVWVNADTDLRISMIEITPVRADDLRHVPTADSSSNSLATIPEGPDL